MSKSAEMKKVEKDLINLKHSPLYKERIENGYFPVIGQGDLNAKIMFIGEAPGKKEAMKGVPFCGASGKILDELLESVGIKRENVYITNIVKDRPTFNRDPKSEEIELYAKLLDKQMEIIKPKIIATLGRFSMEYVMKRFGLESEIENISKIHGNIFETKTNFGKINLIILYHPAVAVYNRSKLKDLKKDFIFLKKVAKK